MWVLTVLVSAGLNQIIKETRNGKWKKAKYWMVEALVTAWVSC